MILRPFDIFFFFNDTATTEIYTLSLHDALPISKKELYLTEDLTKGPNDADNTYGWAKLMGEFTLQAYAKEHGIGAASCRYFTVYGPRGVENHAVMAMIAPTFLGQNPFQVWGNATREKEEVKRIFTRMLTER